MSPLPRNGWESVQALVSDQLDRHEKVQTKNDQEIRDLAMGLLEIKTIMEQNGQTASRATTHAKILAAIAGPAGAVTVKIIEALIP